MGIILCGAKAAPILLRLQENILAQKVRITISLESWDAKLICWLAVHYVLTSNLIALFFSTIHKKITSFL